MAQGRWVPQSAVAQWYLANARGEDVNSVETSRAKEAIRDITIAKSACKTKSGVARLLRNECDRARRARKATAGKASAQKAPSTTRVRKLATKLAKVRTVSVQRQVLLETELERRAKAAWDKVDESKSSWRAQRQAPVETELERRAKAAWAEVDESVAAWQARRQTPTATELVQRAAAAWAEVDDAMVAWRALQRHDST